MLNFTASWCLNCQFNQKVFEDNEIAELCKNVLMVKCDWTNKSTEIGNLLHKFGSAAVPFYVYYPGNGQNYIILPTILTKIALRNALINGKL